jgi:SAM-dependent methyltransferase
MAEWFADDSFWEALYPFVFGANARATAATEAEAVLELVARTPGALLDLCCGPGRHSVPFALNGWQVTGVDLSPYLLGHAREYATERGAAVEWIQSDMRTFSRPAAYDLIVNLFTSFGYFEDAADNRLVLERTRHNLKRDGVFVLDVVGKEIVARIFEDTRSMEADGGVLFMRGRVLDGWSRIENTWTFVRDGKARTYRFRHFLYSADELRALLKDAGFHDVDIYGGLDRSEYGGNANRLVAVAR